MKAVSLRSSPRDLMVGILRDEGIVRPAWKHAETGRNDQSPEMNNLWSNKSEKRSNRSSGAMWRVARVEERWQRR